MIAYFILMHRYPEQFKRLFKAIYDPANLYVVHIDKNAGREISGDITDFLAPFANAELIKSQRTLWGGYSLVDAQLRGMSRLLAMDSGWNHFINLSGQDFPLKSQAYISAFLKRNAGREFIQILDQRVCRPETVSRLEEIYIEALGRIFETRIPRKFMRNTTPYVGTQWMIARRQFCDFVCHAPQVRRFKRFYRNSYIADEGFFQTVMMNGAPHGEIVSNDMRMMEWVEENWMFRPRTYGIDDAASLIASEALFARKFDMIKDSAIFDVLERHIEMQERPTESPGRRPSAFA